MQSKYQNDVARTVAVIDKARLEYACRDPDRPDAKFVPVRSSQDPEIVKAKRQRVRRSRTDPQVVKAQTRRRTAHWRRDLDTRRAPTTAQVAMAMLTALVTSGLDELTPSDRGLVGRMLLDLQARGFSISETQATLRRLRKRIGETAGSTSRPTDSRIGSIVPGACDKESRHSI